MTEVTKQRACALASTLGGALGFSVRVVIGALILVWFVPNFMHFYGWIAVSLVATLALDYLASLDLPEPPMYY